MKKNSYQIVIVHTADHFRYEFLTDWIEGHNEAVNHLYNLRARLLDQDENPSIIWRDMFFNGTDVWRLLKGDSSKPARLGIHG